MEYNDLMGLWKSFQKLETGVPQSHYTRIEVDFSQSRNQGSDVVIKVYGDYISKASYTGDVGDATLRISHRNASEIPLTEFKKSKGVFSSLYITGTDTSGKFVFYVGGAWSGEIETAAGDKVGLLNGDGTDINPATKESIEAVETDVEDLRDRFKSHSFKHKEKTTQTATGTAEKIMAASTPVRWAIIHFETLARVGDADITIDAGVHPGQQYAAGSYLTVEFCDLSEMYIIDAAGVAVIYTINYVEEA